MADNNKESTFMDKVWEGVDKASPYLDVRNDLEQVGNIYGVSEEDRNNSRTKKLVTGEARPASHVATEAGAWLGANVAIPKLAGWIAKSIKMNKGIRAINNDAAGDYFDEGVKSLKDNRVINDLTEAGNRLNSDGVNASKSVSKGKPVKNTKHGAWSANKKEADKIINDAKDAIRIDEIVKNIEPQKIEKLNERIRYLDEISKHITPEEYEEAAYEILGEYDKNVARSLKELANEKGVKTAVMTEALNHALSMAHKLPEDSSTAKVEPLYRKPVVNAPIWAREANKAINQWVLNAYLDVGMNTSEYNMNDVDYLLKTINKDNYWDQDEIDDLEDVEKLWFLKKVAKGKYDTKGHSKSDELAKLYTDLTNTDEDK